MLYSINIAHSTRHLFICKADAEAVLILNSKRGYNYNTRTVPVQVFCVLPEFARYLVIYYTGTGTVYCIIRTRIVLI
jgi:hypothetical protein